MKVRFREETPMRESPERRSEERERERKRPRWDPQRTPSRGIIRLA